MKVRTFWILFSIAGAVLWGLVAGLFASIVTDACTSAAIGAGVGLITLFMFVLMAGMCSALAKGCRDDGKDG